MDDHSAERRFNDIDRRLRKIEQYMMWGTIMGGVRLLLLAIPLVLALIYIPPFVRTAVPYIAPYLEALRQHKF